MSKLASGHWLSQQTKTGLKDLPRNTAWLLSKALQPGQPAAEKISRATSETTSRASDAVESAGIGIRGEARKVKRTISDAAPFAGNSPESLIQRAEEASGDAQSAEDEAVACAEEAKRAAERAQQLTHEANERADLAEQEASREAAARVEAAEKKAADEVARERAKADAAAQKAIHRARAEAQAGAEEAQQDAEDVRARAQAAVERANDAWERARDLADQAVRAAKETAAEADREAAELSEQAAARAAVAARRADEAEQLRRRSATPAGQAANQVPAEVVVANGKGGDGTDRLDELTKRELLQMVDDLALDEVTAAMTKAEIIGVIKDAAA